MSDVANPSMRVMEQEWAPSRNLHATLLFFRDTAGILFAVFYSEPRVGLDRYWEASAAPFHSLLFHRRCLRDGGAHFTASQLDGVRSFHSGALGN